jgi:hypothetical protein
MINVLGQIFVQFMYSSQTTDIQPEDTSCIVRAGHQGMYYDTLSIETPLDMIFKAFCGNKTHRCIPPSCVLSQREPLLLPTRSLDLPRSGSHGTAQTLERRKRWGCPYVEEGLLDPVKLAGRREQGAGDQTLCRRQTNRRVVHAPDRLGHPPRRNKTDLGDCMAPIRRDVMP